MKVAVIIPAHNEAERLPDVLRVLADCSDLWEDLIVVNDGSSDQTSEVARACGVGRVLDLPANQGKGAALVAGARSTDAEILCFLDADLRGLERRHLEDLLRPVLAGEADMALGVFRNGRGFTDLSHRVAPWVSGQRALRRELFLGVSGAESSRLGVEALLTREAGQQAWRVCHVAWTGVTHVVKEEKLGPIRGLWSRLRMYGEILRTLLADRTPAEPVQGRAAAHRAAAAPEK